MPKTDSFNSFFIAIGAKKAFMIEKLMLVMTVIAKRIFIGYFILCVVCF